MAPLGDRILLRPKAEDKKTKGGIIIASNSEPSLASILVGEVLSVGHDVKLPLQKGDFVLYSQYSTSDVETADGKIVFAAEQSVLAKLS